MQVGVATVQVPPLPVTVSPPSPPAVPVLLSTMPLVAPPDEILRKFRSLAPIVVLATLSAVPVAVVIVLSGAVPTAFGSVTLTVPPPCETRRRPSC